jgi:hypothetical protein
MALSLRHCAGRCPPRGLARPRGGQAAGPLTPTLCLGAVLRGIVVHNNA